MEAQDKDVARPSVGDAFGFVIPSYGWLLTRFEAANGRIQSIVTSATGFTFAAVVLLQKANGEKLAYTSPWFLFASAVYLAIVVGGIASQWRGAICLMDPMLLWREHLHKDPEVFKRDMLHFAGQDFADTLKWISRKARAARLLVAGFALELALLGVWSAGL